MRSHLSVVEYWRWWVVHLWVEGYFEVFATVVIAFLFAKLGVIRAESAAQAALLSGAIYLTGGIIGTLHHLYFAGTPTVALAFGSVFSALEIVPLLLVGHEAVAEHSPLQSAAVAQAIQVGRLLLCRGRVLESGRRGNFRIHDQSADRALLHAGLEHDRGARARRALRRLRHARSWTDAVLSAGDEARTQVEGTTDLVCVLGHQYRFDVGDRFEPVAGWFDANLSIGFSRLLVGAQSGVYADRSDADAALVANDRRHRIRPGRHLVRLLRPRPDVATAGERRRRAEGHPELKAEVLADARLVAQSGREFSRMNADLATTTFSRFFRFANGRKHSWLLGMSNILLRV